MTNKKFRIVRMEEGLQAFLDALGQDIPIVFYEGHVCEWEPCISEVEAKKVHETTRKFPSVTKI